MEYNTSNTISLISHVHSITADYLKEKLTLEGLPDMASSHGYILYQLSKSQKLSMTDIAKRINRDKSTTTVLIRKLAKLDLVESVQDENDNRIKYIMLTDKGREYTNITDQLSKDLIEKSFSGFSSQEIEQLTYLLSKIEKNFQK